MFLFCKASEIIESLAGIQFYFYIFTDQILTSREMDQKVIFCSSCKDTFFSAFLLYEDLLNSSLETGRSLSAFFLNQSQKTVKTVFYYILRYLILHFGSRCAASFGINKGKRRIKIAFFHNVQSILEILFRFSRKTYNDICSKGNIRYGITDLVYKFQILFFVITAVNDL